LDLCTPMNNMTHSDSPTILTPLRTGLYARAGLFSVVLSIVLVLLLSVPTNAQTPPPSGHVMGQVLDRDSGEPLPGAQVQIVGTSRGVMAGVAGRFQMQGVDTGEITLRITMLGYASREVNRIEVSPGQVARVQVELTRAAIDLDGITVTADQDQGSAVSLLADQRSAIGVVNAISAEQISRSPDGDAAAAIKRVSGVSVQDGKYVFVRGLGERYTTSSLNGARIPSPEPERKVVPLDLFPSALLQSISTQKTFTPDQPGDFAGASVNIRTPQFPQRRILSASLSTGYAPGITGSTVLAGPTSGREWLAMATGPRQIPDAAANYSGAASRGDEVNGIVNSFRNTWSVREERGAPPLSAGISAGGSTEYFDRTFGYLGSLTYSSSHEVKLDQRRAQAGTGDTEMDRYDGESGTASVLWGGMLNTSVLLGNHTQIQFNNSYNRSADHEARLEEGMDENTRARVRVERLTYIERTVRANQLKGEHQFGPRHALDWSLTSSAVSRQEPDRSEFVTWLEPDVPVWFNDFEGAVRTFGGLEEGSFEAGTGYAFSFGETRGNPSRLRVGASIRSTERDTWSQGFRMQAFFWSPDDPRWQASPEEFFDGRYAGAGDDNFLLSRELSGGSYQAEDRLSAAYAMAEMNVTDRIRLIGGARFEQYRLEVDSENQLGQPARTDRSYSDLLPALTANVQLTRNQQLRLSASRTLARPEYRELAPITYREVLGGDQVIGNADLERTLIDNLDLRWEWYPNPGEILSIALFSKNFDQPVEQRYLARSGTNTRTFENADKGTSRGVEFEVLKGLAAVSPALAPLSVFANATVMKSRIVTGQDEPDRPMVGQAPFVVNSGITWSPLGGDLSTTLLYNVVGKRIVNARASGSSVSNVVERPRQLLDLSLRMPLPGAASGKIDLKNLLDTPHEVVQGSTVREFHRSGRSISAGVSWRW